VVLEKQIAKYIRDNQGVPPWPLGYIRISSEAEILARLLPFEQLVLISRHNPVKMERNRALKKLNKQYGVPQAILKELSGLAFSTIKRATFNCYPEIKEEE